MATCTYLQMVSDEELTVLAKKPADVGKIDKPASETFSTYYFTALNWFLCGNAYPTKKHPLGALLCGEKSIKTSTLENGSFDVNSAATTAKLATAIADVDAAKIKKAVAAADLDELRDEEEVDEENALEESGDAPAEIAKAIKALQKFYASAAKKKLGVVIYTT